MPDRDLGRLSEAHLDDESKAAIAAKDENRFLAVEAERSRRIMGARGRKPRLVLSGDALATWRERAANPSNFQGGILIRTEKLRYASYRTLDFLYNGPADRIQPADRDAIENEWRQRERRTYEWPYLTMRERHRLRTGLSASLSIASLFIIVALCLISKDAKASALGYRLLGNSLVGMALGFVALGVLPVLVGRAICRIRGVRPSTARPDFRIGRTRAIVTASCVVLLGFSHLVAAQFLPAVESALTFSFGLFQLAVGSYYLWSGKPAASEDAFVLWGRLHGRLKD